MPVNGPFRRKAAACCRKRIESMIGGAELRLHSLELLRLLPRDFFFEYGPFKSMMQTF